MVVKIGIQMQKRLCGAKPHWQDTRMSTRKASELIGCGPAGYRSKTTMLRIGNWKIAKAVPADHIDYSPSCEVNSCGVFL